MEISKVFSFLTYPGKGKEGVAPVNGTEIAVDNGKLCTMLNDIYVRSDGECNIPIAFTSENGAQENAARTLIKKIVDGRKLDAADLLANRLQSVTGGASGMALLFVCLGKVKDRKIVISRFPADEGIVAEKHAGKLSVEFVEQVFLKSAHAYKAVVYRGDDAGDDFWSGHAVDRQINHGAKAVADYWIIDFLKSDFRTTAAAGTKRLALALRTALKDTPDSVVRHEISMAAQLAKNIGGKKTLTIDEFCNDLHLSEDAKKAVTRAVNPARLLHDKFRFDQAEFTRHIAYKSVELNNGALLTAQVTRFDECFATTVSPKDPTFITFSTSGQIVDEKLKRTK